jgi:hypothetical protein
MAPRHTLATMVASLSSLVVVVTMKSPSSLVPVVVTSLSNLMLVMTATLLLMLMVSPTQVRYQELATPTAWG